MDRKSVVCGKRKKTSGDAYYFSLHPLPPLATRITLIYVVQYQKDICTRQNRQTLLTSFSFFFVHTLRTTSSKRAVSPKSIALDLLFRRNMCYHRSGTGHNLYTRRLCVLLAADRASRLDLKNYVLITLVHHVCRAHLYVDKTSIVIYTSIVRSLFLRPQHLHLCIMIIFPLLNQRAFRSTGRRNNKRVDGLLLILTNVGNVSGDRRKTASYLSCGKTPRTNCTVADHAPSVIGISIILIIIVNNRQVYRNYFL